jgi:two-component system nitrate/nitrite response regulator NarL
MVSVTVLGARALFRAGLVDLLSAIGFTPIEEADDAAELRRRLGDSSPKDMLITALARGGGAISDTVRDIRTWLGAAKVVCLVPEFDLDEMRACFAAGASGYVLESITREALRESLRLVDAGEKVFPSELALQFPMLTAKAGTSEGETPASPETVLSSREIEILQCLANGQSNKAIAKNLAIAEATVKVHVKRILRKANATNRTQAALWAIATGLAAAPGLRSDELGAGPAIRSEGIAVTAMT